ncbi:MAG: hypothetical protein MK212_15055 [Saprospiraceae bacterium]|nr:hypothetical protein [Saprospiraceae bacterium]
MRRLRQIKKILNIFLAEKRKESIEKAILVIAIIGYIFHLLVILLNTQGVIHLEQKFFKNPIAAIYTPFSFILIYEVFLLVYFLPKSITIYIGKQYEIITLIVIRRIFKDLGYIELNSGWFQNQKDLQFTFDVLTSLILFFLIFLFYKGIKKRTYTSIEQSDKRGRNIKSFVLLKSILAIILIPTLFILAAYTIVTWAIGVFHDYNNGILEFSKINSVFFDDFFTLLIIVDVLLLMASFFYSDKFHKIIRNSGFVISTILIKISFLSVGIINNILIVGAVLFGYLILLIHNLYDENPQ